MKNGVVPSENKEMYAYIYKHLYNIPAHTIEESVILVSPSNQTIKILSKLNHKASKSNQKPPQQPQMCRLEEGITVIHPTEGLLNPEQKHKFVTMHYIFKTVKRAKFILVFSQSDFTNNGFKTIRSTMDKLLSLFINSSSSKDQKGRIVSQVSQSSRLVVMDVKRNPQHYIGFFQRANAEKKFFQTQELKEFNKNLGQKEKLLLFDKDFNNQKFVRFVQEIPYIQLKNKITFNLQSNFDKYRDQFSDNRWVIMLREILQRIQQPVLNSPSKLEEYILKEIRDFAPINLPTFFQSQFLQPRNNNDLKQFVQNQFLLNWFQVIQFARATTQQQQQTSKQLIHKILKAFYDSGYFKDKLIEYFFSSYFEINRFLTGIFQKATFKQALFSRAESLNEQVGTIITADLQLLENKLHTADISYPFQFIIDLLDKIIRIHKDPSKLQYLFWTSRTDKKYKKYRCQFAYKRAFLLGKQYKVSKIDQISSWVIFLENCLESALIDPAKIINALTVIADLLTQAKQYSLALKIYDLLPEFKVYTKVIRIYEKEMKLYPEMLKNSLLQDWQTKLKQIKDYCSFLIKIGLAQKVRELCLQGLRVMSLEQNKRGNQAFKKILIQARSSRSQQIHGQFLENSIISSKKVIISNTLLNEIKQTYIYL